jgi:hypothetical protein
VDSVGRLGWTLLQRVRTSSLRLPSAHLSHMSPAVLKMAIHHCNPHVFCQEKGESVYGGTGDRTDIGSLIFFLEETFSNLFELYFIAP